jgi:hypothetical protein
MSTVEESDAMRADASNDDFDDNSDNDLEELILFSMSTLWLSLLKVSIFEIQYNGWNDNNIAIDPIMM